MLWQKWKIPLMGSGSRLTLLNQRVWRCVNRNFLTEKQKGKNKVWKRKEYPRTTK
jgi:hypothetical protein